MASTTIREPGSPPGRITQTIPRPASFSSRPGIRQLPVDAAFKIDAEVAELSDLVLHSPELEGIASTAASGGA